MSDTTKIEWADSTFNPWIGCTKVSTEVSGGGGCDHCYAERDTPVRVLRGKGIETWGTGAPRQRTSAEYWKQPLRWNERPFFECAECSTECNWRGECDAGACPSCGGHVVSARRRVFCASLADVFDNEVDPAWRADLFALVDATPNIDWLLLTKRIGNAHRMIAEALAIIVGRHHTGSIGTWPWPHVWLGATVVNQAEADRDVPKLLRTAAACRFLSIEPMLGEIDLLRAVSCEHCQGFGFHHHGPDEIGCSACEGHQASPIDLAESGLDWVIAGGESGHGARPADPQWFRSLRDQCAAAGVPFLFKQWGEWGPDAEASRACLGCGGEKKDVATSAGDCRRCGPTEWDEVDDPDWSYSTMTRFGKAAAGRALDGAEHNGFPEAH